MTQRIEALPQRQLALELVFQIDHARASPRDKTQSVARIRALIGEHPSGILSRHVRHQLGYSRLVWLDEEGLLKLHDWINWRDS